MYLVEAMPKVQKNLACVHATLPYARFFLDYQDHQIHEAISVLMEQPHSSDHPIGELLMDLSENPSSNVFLRSRIDRVYQLNPLSSWILTLAILRSSLGNANWRYLKEAMEWFYQ